MLNGVVYSDEPIYNYHLLNKSSNLNNHIGDLFLSDIIHGDK